VRAEFDVNENEPGNRFRAAAWCRNMPLFLQIVPVRDAVRDGSNVHAARRKQGPYQNAFS
jgi:hypothetical protein